MTDEKIEKQVISRTVKFEDENNLTLTSLIQESLVVDDLTLPGSYQKKELVEKHTLQKIREQQRTNVDNFEQTTKELLKQQSKPLDPPETPPARVLQLIKDLEEANKYKAAKQAYDKWTNYVETLKKERVKMKSAIEVCSMILSERQKQFPESSIEDIDSLKTTDLEE